MKGRRHGHVLDFEWISRLIIPSLGRREGQHGVGEQLTRFQPLLADQDVALAQRAGLEVANRNVRLRGELPVCAGGGAQARDVRSAGLGVPDGLNLDFSLGGQGRISPPAQGGEPTPFDNWIACVRRQSLPFAGGGRLWQQCGEPVQGGFHFIGLVAEVDDQATMNVRWETKPRKATGVRTDLCLIFFHAKELEIAEVKQPFIAKYCGGQSTKPNIGPLDSPGSRTPWVKVTSQCF